MILRVICDIVSYGAGSPALPGLPRRIIAIVKERYYMKVKKDWCDAPAYETGS